MLDWKEASIDTAAGTFAGIAQVGIGHPLDTIKIRMQAQSVVRMSSSSNSTTKSFDSIFSTLRTTLQRDGARGLYKGAASPLCGAMLQNASGFMFWGWSKKLFQEKENEQLSGGALFKAGLVVGVLCLMVENPVDLIKTQMQVQVGSGSGGGRYRSVFDVGSVIIRERGFFGLYQAAFANSLRFVPGRAVYLSSFEASNRWLQQSGDIVHGGGDQIRSGGRGQTSSYTRCFMAGGIAGGCAWMSTYPFDVVRNIMMGDHIHPAKRRYKSVWHCGSSIVQADGFTGLWRGLTPCLLRAVPVNGCIFVMYKSSSEEIARRWR
jgi:solute carrier family 25 carnitine/acylcarnitine transporter 20/29